MRNHGPSRKLRRIEELHVKKKSKNRSVTETIKPGSMVKNAPSVAQKPLRPPEVGVPSTMMMNLSEVLITTKMMRQLSSPDSMTIMMTTMTMKTGVACCMTRSLLNFLSLNPSAKPESGSEISRKSSNLSSFRALRMMTSTSSSICLTFRKEMMILIFPVPWITVLRAESKETETLPNTKQRKTTVTTLQNFSSQRRSIRSNKRKERPTMRGRGPMRRG